MPVKPIPEGYHSVTPYLVLAEGVSRLIDFLKQAFGAEEIGRMSMPDGSVKHAEVRIGNSPVMMGETGGQPPAMPCCLYLYVEDVDAVYRRAVEAGGIPIKEPADQFYGDRSGGVRDFAGNAWWIGTRVEEVSPGEMARRSAELNK